MIEYVMVAFFLASGAEKGAPAPKAVSPARLRHEVVIQADRFEIDGRKQRAVYVGNVRVKRSSTRLKCDRLVADYTRDQEITRLACTGNVEVQDGDRWAKGERADFDNVDGVLHVTGSPEARQGRNVMRGTRVTFEVGGDVIRVENAVTVFQPQKDGAPLLPAPASRKDGARR